MISLQAQQGIGLIEVMIALALILIAALAVGHMQTSSVLSARASSMHFSLDNLSNEMLETLRAQASDAESGVFEFDGSVETTEPVNGEVSSWNTRVLEAIPTGIGTISCTDGFCDVSISWVEEIDGSNYRQFYRVRTPL
ncbi:MAG: prepilin-type N-terminal cleavage/methylation domain-containing protein [Granulosicoccus sp.]